MQTQSVINLEYVVASVLFIFCLIRLAHPRTAVRGNLLGALGMLIAIVATLMEKEVLRYEVIIAGMVVGTVIGLILALKVRMTAMPQMVALLNGFGGGASLLVAGAELTKWKLFAEVTVIDQVIATAFSGLVGSVTFWGSLVAYGKLEGLIDEKSVLFKRRHLSSIVLGLIVLALSWLVIEYPMYTSIYWLLCIVSAALGVLLVIAIGGADMPVVICLLNSYSGIAAASTGFVLNNNGLVIAGALVGASGIILCQIMCKAMNRSLLNVLFGGLGSAESGPVEDSIYEGKIKSTSPEEIAMLFDSARRVVIVPGYGLAVSQAQHSVRDLSNLLESRGIEVEFGIHPVAGRMPGHMNILLAEANISYEKVKEMDAINPTFSQTDVVVVIGANDVVNPDARSNPNSPIAGMPILDVDQAKTVVVVKRSLSPGFAGIPNPLFAADNTLMYFADGKKAVLDLIAAIKEG